MRALIVVVLAVLRDLMGFLDIRTNNRPLEILSRLRAYESQYEHLSGAIPILSQLTGEGS